MRTTTGWLGALIVSLFAGTVHAQAIAPPKAAPSMTATTPPTPSGPTAPGLAPTALPPAPTPTLPPPIPSGGFGWLLLQMILALVAICALAYAVLRWGVRRFQTGPLGRARGMRVVSRLGLEPRRSLYVVAIGPRHFVVGVGEGGVSLLTELDADTAAELDSPPPERTKTSFKDLLSRKKP